MYASVLTKTVRDRWLGMTIGVGVLVAYMLMAMAVYRDIDFSIYGEMPDYVLNLMGVPKDADIATLAYGVMYGFTGSLTLAGLALSMGGASISGEEKDGTIGLLLANPKSRTEVLVAKAGAMVALVTLGSLVLWVASLATPAMLGIDIGESHVEAVVLHVTINTLFYGFMALAVGAWTGRRALASGVTMAVMISGYFAVGLLPLIDGLADLAKLFPWYWLDGGDPLVNGVQWWHLGLLATGTAALFTAAVVGVNHRDLRSQETSVSLLDRLRAHPLTRQIGERLAGSARVSHISVKTASEHQGVLVVSAASMFSMLGLLMGPLYKAMESSMAQFADVLPEAMMAYFGGGDFTSPEGFYQIETFGLMAPIAVMVVTIVVGAKAMAGEEVRRTMGLLLANPIPRSRVVLEKALTMVAFAVIVGVSTFAGVAGGSLIAGLGISMADIAATCLLVTLLGLVFGALALALSAACGSVKVANYATIGAAFTLHLLNGLLPLNDDLAGWARWSPFHYYLSSDPLKNGMHWGHATVLAGLVVVLVAMAVGLFDRRDLRQRD